MIEDSDPGRTTSDFCESRPSRDHRAVIADSGLAGKDPSWIRLARN